MIWRRGAVAAALDASVGAQSLAPTATLANGTWTIGGGSASRHAALADESDSTLIIMGDTTASVARFTLASATDPARSTGHVIRLRALSSNGTGTIRVALYEGATVRKAFTSLGSLTSSAAAYAVTLSGAEADAITDYTGLELRIEGTATLAQNVQVTRARFDLDA